VDIGALILGLLLGGLVGFLAGHVLTSKRAGERRVDLEARLARTAAERDASRRESETNLAVLRDAQKQSEETFKALAGDALRANSESFLAHARSRMETLLAQADGGMEKRREAIEKLLAPLGETLKRYEAFLHEIEKERGQAYGDLRGQVKAMIADQQRLQRETANLVNALKLPQVRGQWGEMTLRRTAELAGMVERCDFTEQVALPGNRLRPDMIVHLPGGRDIVVDSKVSLTAYLAGIEATEEEAHTRAFADHARQVRDHMMRLSGKEYARQLDKAPDFTVLFLPGEPFFSAAAQSDPDLLADGLKRGVIIATPTTLIALLWAVAYGWRQAQVEENAKKIAEEGNRLYERTRVLLGHFTAIGPALKGAVNKYNEAAASLEKRFTPSAKRLKDLAASASEDLPEIVPIEESPHPPDAAGLPENE